MKIIGSSNFDDEMVSDLLVCENVNEHFGEKIVKLLNDKGDDYSTYYFKLKPDDYKLYEFEY